MQPGKSQELIAYWEQLRGPRAAPERSEIAPAAIARQLADIFILQASPGGEPKFRLAGTRICSIHGRELKDTSFAALWQAQDRHSILRLIANSMTGKSPVGINAEGTSARERAALFEFTLLPLANEIHEQFLIGMIVTLGQPFWLESDSIVENRIRSIATLEPRRIRTDQSVARLAQGPKSAIHTIIGGKADHLQLLDGGKTSRQVKGDVKPLPRR
ncbi:PAS domain-containing protein [Phyllobacterium sp. SB3]|uniref:PAS domain-containing protein n=1 Tax=Phyllobacterium sp. SB3 TaxID=3156073 RepID=UPI0032AEDEEF